MGKRKRGFKKTKAPEKFAYGSDEEAVDTSDAESSGDEIEKFEQDQELKLVKEKKVTFGGDDDSALSSDEEEIPLESDSDDEEEDDEEELEDEDDEEDGEAEDDNEEESKEDHEDGEDESIESNEDEFGDDYGMIKSQHIIQAQKDEMGSDIEANTDDDDLPNAKAWGKKKSVYFGTDYVDKDFRRTQQEEEELALAEEEEAKAIQKRLLGEIKEADLELNRLPEIRERDEEPVKKIEVDINSLSRREKLEYLKKDSPELSNLIEDFKTSLAELEKRKVLLNYKHVDDLIAYQKSLPCRVYKTKFLLLTRYCMNISFYLILKSDAKPIRNHPCISSLVKLKKMLLELEKIENKKEVKKLIQDFKEKIASNNRIEMNVQRKEPEEDEIDLRDYDDDEPSRSVTKKRIRFADENEDQHVTPEDDIELRDYGDLREPGDDEDDEEDDEGPDDEDLDEEEDDGLEGEAADNYGEDDMEADEVIKRPINYQIAKNKGLTPKKRKENRNPRVKHRRKFKKATARRKGQVRPPRKEIKKYSGEISGIRSSVVKSIKFK